MTREQRTNAFWAKVDKSGDCWLWSCNRHQDGYGKVSFFGTKGAHRVAYQLGNGPIPEGMHVLHRCDNPPCCNPAHLFLGTHSENVRDMIAKGRHMNGNKRKTHCKRGHEYTPDNTYLSKGLGRTCKKCQLAAQIRRRAA